MLELHSQLAPQGEHLNAVGVHVATRGTADNRWDREPGATSYAQPSWMGAQAFDMRLRNHPSARAANGFSCSSGGAATTRDRSAGVRPNEASQERNLRSASAAWATSG